MNEYCQRFKLSHWYQVLVLVVVSFPSQLRGSMEPLNDLAKAVRDMDFLYNLTLVRKYADLDDPRGTLYPAIQVGGSTFATPISSITNSYACFQD